MPSPRRPFEPPRQRPLARALLGIAIGALTACTPHNADVATLDAEPSAYRFAAVPVFDGEALQPPSDVLVVGDRIVALGPAGSLAGRPGTETVTCDGCTLVPGLVDSHVHLDLDGAAPWQLQTLAYRDFARTYLYAGVTTVLVARSNEGEKTLAEQARNRAALSPLLLLSGPSLTGPGSHPIPLMEAALPWPLGIVFGRLEPQAATPEQARTRVRAVAAHRKPPFFKIYYDAFPPGSPHMSREVLFAAADEARQNGMRPIVHVGTAADSLDAAEAGAALLMHAAYQDRFSPEQVDRLRVLRVPVVPTLRAFSASAELLAGRVPTFDRQVIDSQIIEIFQSPPNRFLRSDLRDWTKDNLLYGENQAENTRRLYDAGIPLLAGTDSGVSGVFPGAALHDELAALARLGIPPIEVLRMATSRPADFVDPRADFGRIAPGQRANLLLVQGDPTTDIGAVDRIVDVWLAGRRLVRTPAR